MALFSTYQLPSRFKIYSGDWLRVPFLLSVGKGFHHIFVLWKTQTTFHFRKIQMEIQNFVAKKSKSGTGHPRFRADDRKKITYQEIPR